MALGMLMAVGAAIEGDYQNSQDQYDQSQYGQSGYNPQYGSGTSGQVLAPPHDKKDHRDHSYNDWLSPGPLYWQYSYPAYYPAYYSYNYWWYNDDYWWNTHNPKYYYHYTTPATYYYTWYPTTYTWDPWYATNVYGLSSTTYYYTNSWSYHSGGFFFGP